MGTGRRMESFYDKPTLEPDWEAGRRFHGHLGPWLALGMRMGRDALGVLRTAPHFGISVVVRCDLKPPVSCLIDGLQWMTGATYGKRNISAEQSSEVHVRVEVTETGQAVEMAVLSEAAAHIGRLFEELGDEAAAHALYEADGTHLYSTRIVSSRT